MGERRGGWDEMGPTGEWQITWPTPLASASDRLVIMHATHVASTLGNIHMPTSDAAQGASRDQRVMTEDGEGEERAA